MDPWTILPALVAIALVFVVAPVGLTTFMHWRRPVRVICPRVEAQAQIQVHAAGAALAALAGRGAPGVRQCSLWPLRGGCRAECLALLDPASRPAASAGFGSARP